MAASSSDHHSPRGSNGGGGGGGGVNSPSFQKRTALPYAEVVRGEIESLSLNEQAVPLADCSAKTLKKDVIVAVNDNPSSPNLNPTPAVARDECCSDGNNEGSAVSQQLKKPVWNKVSNGSVEVGPVMGAVSWPALSECTSKVSSRSNDADYSSPMPVSNGVLPAPQGPNSSKAPQTQGVGSDNNPGSRHAFNGRPRQTKRGSSTANGPRPVQGGFIRTPPPPPMVSSQPQPVPLSVQLPAPPSSQIPSPSLTPPPFPLLDFSQGNYGNFIPVLPHAPPRESPYPRPIPGFAPSHAVNNHFSQRSPSRRPRGEGPYNNNHVGRPDRNPDFSPRSANGRDVRMQHPRAPPPPGNFLRHPPPGSPTFIAPPLVGPFPMPMGFNEMRHPFIIIPTMLPDHLRGMPFFTREPTSPMGFPTSDTTLPNLLLNQINFYFSDANLERDEYLRSQMDEDGWVHITVIASFTRVKQLTNDIHLILEALQPSTVVEVKDGKIRKRNEWKKYVKPASQLSTDANSQAHSQSSENELAKDLQNLEVGECSSKESSTMDEDVPVSEAVLPIRSSSQGTD